MDETIARMESVRDNPVPRGLLLAPVYLTTVIGGLLLLAAVLRRVPFCRRLAARASAFFKAYALTLADRFTSTTPPVLPLASPDTRVINQFTVPVVMVVNPRSGGGLGSAVQEVVSRLPESEAPEVLSLTVEGLNEALRRLVQLSKAPHVTGSQQPIMGAAANGTNQRHTAVGARAQPTKVEGVRLVCAGGDGTASALIRTLAERGLAETVPVAVMPLGTGNDVARSLGMGGSPPPIQPQAMQKWFGGVRAARVRRIDVWRVSFCVHAGGSIRVLRNGQETVLPESEVRGSSILYTSIGLDARLVWEVEAHRQKRRFLNQLLYACIGGSYVALGWALPTLTGDNGGNDSDDQGGDAEQVAMRQHRLLHLQQQSRNYGEGHQPQRASSQKQPTLTNGTVGYQPGHIARMVVDGFPLPGTSLPSNLQSMICISSPSYAGKQRSFLSRLTPGCSWC